ncbi:hypothetical protein C6V83_11715 [Gordonia iterans]|uniref:ABC transporter substrate-binding protein n=1 Tax=Gordonia iterans TaxID=1004901 RepID=A0A2S0KGM4_9ACTN|nr:substrate-binding domain-containing protein [Gordonia iterans]AVM00829.1 hypothetical protein C6V83_11715 [Gordonia iterans]
MGEHQSGTTGRTKYTVAMTAGILLIILVVAVTVAVVNFPKRATSTTKVLPCPAGPLVVPVAADPAIAPALQEIAKSYFAQTPVLDDYCVEVQVRPADARTIMEGLTADSWNAHAYGVYPAAWVPESSVWTAAVAAADPGKFTGRPEHLVSSPVRIATEPVLARAAADSGISWADLPSLTRANSLRAYGYGSWGSLRMAMPQGAQSDATSLTGQAVAAATVGTREPLTLEQARSSAVTTAMRELVSAPPRVGDGSAEAAVKEIAETTNPATAPVRAVPISEQRLYAVTKDDAQAKVAVVAPSGLTPVLDYPVVSLTGSEVSATMTKTIAEFVAFARKPDQMKLLTQSGFRGPGPLPSDTATVKFGELGDTLPVPVPQATVAINRIVLPSAVPGS